MAAPAHPFGVLTAMAEKKQGGGISPTDFVAALADLVSAKTKEESAAGSRRAVMARFERMGAHKPGLQLMLKLRAMEPEDAELTLASALRSAAYLLYALLASCIAAAGLLLTGLLTAGCDDKPATNVAPTSSALTAAKPPAMGALKFSVDRETTKVEFLMDAPQEKIRGKAYKSTTGELQIDTCGMDRFAGAFWLQRADGSRIDGRIDGALTVDVDPAVGQP